MPGPVDGTDGVGVLLDVGQQPVQRRDKAAHSGDG